MKKILVSALLAAPLLAMADGNIVRNGSFETNPLLSGQSYFMFDAIDGWNGSSQGIEVRIDYAGVALDGRYFVELDANRNSSMYQLLDTKAGQSYSLSFSYANRIHTDASTNGLEWSLDGNSWSTLAALPTNNTDSQDWKLFTASFVATGETKLSFRAIGTDDGLGSSLDDIRVTAVPEPQTYALLLAGLMALGFVSRRQQQG